MFGAEIGTSLMIFTYSDCAEIFIASYGIYQISRWLSFDKQTNLLSAFYGYCLLTIICYYAQLTSVTMLLCLASPLLLISFFLIHRTTLQKNFIAMKNNSSKSTAQHAWLAESMRAALCAINSGKQIFMLIEQTDSLASFVTCQLPINAPTQHELLNVLLSSSSYQQNNMLWLSSQGTLLGINTVWNYELDTNWFDNAIQNLDAWKQYALFMTTKTDAVFVHLEPVGHKCTIIAQGIAHEQLRLERALTVLAKCLNVSPVSLEKGEAFYAHYYHKQSTTQHTT